MRTYTIRDVRGSGGGTTIVVDVVLHLEGDAVGPGSLWAARAATGDRLVMMAPRRGFPFGGIEFAPGPGAELLMVGDETAVPAVCAVLEQLPAEATGAAFMEVPEAGDVLDVRRPDGVSVTWLPRRGRPARGAAARRGGRPPRDARGRRRGGGRTRWTPTCGRPRRTPPRARRSPPPAGASGRGLDGLYAWIAGESAVVTGLRRHLVRGLGMDRSQVAFMGYWRRGVAMRS